MRILITLSLLLFLSGCSGSWMESFRSIEPIPKSGIHRVMHGETLYAVAYRYGLTLKSVAQRNDLKPPYYIYTGELIYLRGYAPVKPQVAPQPPTPIVMLPGKPLLGHEMEPVAAVNKWKWPAHGKVIGPFCALNRGINISGHMGDAIYASAAGKVIYSGNGLRTYGNMIIIKHNGKFLTTYAHNDKNIVHEGDWVKPGQKIAEMGNTGTHRVMLHYEIRRGGEPVNPMDYLNRA